MWATFECNAFRFRTRFPSEQDDFFEVMPERIRSSFRLSIQNTRHAQTLVHECFAFSARPVPFNLIFVNFQMGSSYVLTSTSRVGFNLFLKYFVALMHNVRFYFKKREKTDIKNPPITSNPFKFEHCLK